MDIVPVDGELGRYGGCPLVKEERSMHHFCLRIEPFDADEIQRYLKEKGVRFSDIETN